MKNIKRACILNCTNVKSLKRIVTHNYVDLNLFFTFRRANLQARCECLHLIKINCQAL